MDTKEPQRTEPLQVGKTEHTEYVYLAESEQIFRKLDFLLVVLLAAIGVAVYLVWKSKNAASQ